MPYNPKYYIDLIENSGFGKAKDLYAWKISKENGVQSAIALLAQWGLLTPPDINDVPVLNDDAAYPKTATTV